jgi:hypothetical protein
MTLISIKRKLKTLSLVYCLLLVIGFALGWLGFLMFGDIAGSCRVVVVSKSAILEFERERVKLEDGSYDAKSLFFGNQREFIDLVARYAGSYKDKKTKVVLVSDETGNVLGAENITAEIYYSVVKHQELNKPSGSKKANKTTAKELFETPE